MPGPLHCEFAGPLHQELARTIALGVHPALLCREIVRTDGISCGIAALQ